MALNLYGDFTGILEIEGEMISNESLARRNSKADTITLNIPKEREILVEPARNGHQERTESVDPSIVLSNPAIDPSGG